MKDNKKTLVIVAIIVFLVIFFAGILIGKYNNMVKLEEDVSKSYYDIDAQLQRRADLIPNLVNTVKGYTSQEEQIFNSVLEARKELLSANNVEEASKANNELTKSLNNLFVIIENYPDLKSNQNFLALQDELAGTENRIAVARIDYNKTVTVYNRNVKIFPNNIRKTLF